MVTFHDNFFTGSQSASYDYQILLLRSQFDKSFFCRSVFTSHVYVSPAFFDDDGFHRYGYGVFAHVEQQQHFGRLARQQYMVGIGHLCAYRKCSGQRVDLRFGKVDKTFVGILRIVGEGDRDIRLP